MSGPGEAGEVPRHQAQAAKAVDRAAAVAAGAEKQKRKRQNLLRAVDEVLKSAAGQIFWAHLFEISGYSVSSLTKKADGEIAELSTECKEAQRLLYINLRKLPSRELLRAAEAYAESEVSQEGE